MAGKEYVPKHKDTIYRKSNNLDIMQLYKSCSRKHTCNNVVAQKNSNEDMQTMFHKYEVTPFAWQH